MICERCGRLCISLRDTWFGKSGWCMRGVIQFLVLRSPAGLLSHLAPTGLPDSLLWDWPSGEAWMSSPQCLHPGPGVHRGQLTAALWRVPRTVVRRHWLSSRSPPDAVKTAGSSHPEMIRPNLSYGWNSTISLRGLQVIQTTHTCFPD